MRILKINTDLTVEDKEIKGNLKSLQREVEGLITLAPYFYELEEMNIDIYADDEGLLKENPITTLVKIEDNQIVASLVGNLVFTTVDDDGESISLSDKQIKFIYDHLEMVEIVGHNRRTEEEVRFRCFTFNFD